MSAGGDFGQHTPMMPSEIARQTRMSWKRIGVIM
jgi:hypothetical protein